MQIVPFRSADVYQAMRVVLAKGYTSGADHGLSRQQIAREIGVLIKSCYASFDWSPLSRLRELFPNFKWTFRDMRLMSKKDAKAELFGIVAQADIFWEIADLSAVVVAEWLDRSGRDSDRWHYFGNSSFAETSEETAETLRQLCVRDMFVS